MYNFGGVDAEREVGGLGGSKRGFWKSFFGRVRGAEGELNKGFFPVEKKALEYREVGLST